MVNKYRIVLAFVSMLFALQSTDAQYTFFRPDGAFVIEVSLPNTELSRLPIYRNAISSLMVKGDVIVGATTSSNEKSPFLFTASIDKRKVLKVYDLGNFVPGQKALPTEFARTKDYSFIGTMGVDSSGHLLRVSVGGDGILSIKDLGSPVPGEDILALTISDDSSTLYGITFPSGIFFGYHISQGETRTFHDLQLDEETEKVVEDYALEPMDYLSKSLIVDNNGKIWGSAPINKLFSFDPKTNEFELLEDMLPEVWGRRTLGAVESWTISSSGLIYGGNAGDGQLFRLDPGKKQVKNLGKPIMMNRLRALTFADDGKLYGLAGAPPGYTHLFSYDQENGYSDLGNPEFEMRAPGIEQGIWWRGFNLGSMVTSEDKKFIIMGEDESLSQLMVFPIH